MKSTILLVALASTLLAACSTTQSGTTGNSSNAAASGTVNPYPLKTCIVTDTGLYSMGTPITKVYGNQEVKFCCRPCIAKYEENPSLYEAKLKG